MDSCISAVPQISISPAPPSGPLFEPFSPFDSQPSSPAVFQDSYRPALLSPPPTISPRLVRQSSPLRPVDVNAKGLDSDRFEALLASTRERNAASGGKKALDLRKEIALKAHKSKQMERRALFLSKVQAPPSPTATSTPKTPPESPAIFHYSLPSPGLVSPLALFEAIGQQEGITGNIYSTIQPWVEQVDFRLPAEKKASSVSKSPAPQSNSRSLKPLPSLDQITARLGNHGHVKEDKVRHRSPIPLPAFLRSGSPPRKASPEPTPIPRPRLVFPIGNRQKALAAVAQPVPEPHKLHALTPSLPPTSPRSPFAPKLQVTTTVVPRSCSTSPTNLTESNLSALNSRARTGRDMMSTLRRRMATDVSAHGMTGYDEEMDERKLRRISAPAELPYRVRLGFEHPVLSIPGGF